MVGGFVVGSMIGGRVFGWFYVNWWEVFLLVLCEFVEGFLAGSM